MRYPFLFVIILISLHANSQTVTPSWASVYHDTCQQGITLEIEAEPTGNNYTFAFFNDSNTAYPNSGYNILVKYDPNGQLLWSDTLRLTPAGMHAQMKLGSDGCIYIATRHPTAPYAGQFVILRIAAGGNLLWRNNYTAPAQVGEVNAISFDDSMNVYLAGTSQNQDHAVMMKCDSSGTLKWAVAYSFVSTYLDRAHAISADSHGNAYVGIESMGLDARFDFVLVKYSANGIFQWEQRFAQFETQGAYFVEVYHDTSIMMCGYRSDTAADANILTMKYDSSGNLKWWQEFDSDLYYNIQASRNDTPGDMAVTHSGKVAVAGICANSGMPKWVNLLYDQSGNLLWAQSDYDICWARSAKEDADGNLVFAADAMDTVSNIGGIGVSKYDTLGNLMWRTIYSAIPLNGPAAIVMDVDSLGNIYCTGISHGPLEYSITTIKFDYTTQVEEYKESDKSVLVFPNPTKDMIQFQFVESTESKRYVIYNSAGQEIQSGAFNGNILQISTLEFPDGIYFYSLIAQEGEVSNGKFVVAH